MAVGDIYQSVVTVDHPSGEETQAAFYYRVIVQGGEITAENVSDEIVTNILPGWQAICANSYQFNQVRTINGMDNNDFNVTNPSLVGTSSALVSAPQLAMAFRSPGPPPGGRYGYKRLTAAIGTSVGTSDGSMPANIRSTAIAIQNALGTLLELSGGTIEPALITGGFRLGVAPTFGRSLQGQWQLNAFPSTQNTRKRYNWFVQT